MAVMVKMDRDSDRQRDRRCVRLSMLFESWYLSESMEAKNEPKEIGDAPMLGLVVLDPKLANT